MRIAIVGAGAVGSFLGATLALAGQEVDLVARTPDTPSGTDELVVHEPDGSRRTATVTRAGALAAAAAPPPDVVIVAVKQPSLDGALDVAGAWPDAALVTVQNGIGAEEVALARRPGAPLLAASLTAAVEPVEDGVRRRRRGGLALATVAGPDRDLERDLGAAFRAGGLHVRHAPEWRSMKWSKLLANLVANAVPALIDEDPAAVYADPRLFDLERRQLLEGLAVMGALGLRPVALPGADTRLLAFAVRLPPAIGRVALGRVVAGARGGKGPSLRLHLGRPDAGPSEVAWLNGAVAAAGQRLGVPTPVNGALSRLVDEATADADRRAALVGRPDRLLDAI